ncbi:MAG: hypothetical protein L0216_01515 [Planctomycetales bacterium]|nr:hypothetical protein [Planctomycetales bacterium]
MYHRQEELWDAVEVLLGLAGLKGWWEGGLPTEHALEVRDSGQPMPPLVCFAWQLSGAPVFNSIAKADYPVVFGTITDVLVELYREGRHEVSRALADLVRAFADPSSDAVSEWIATHEPART